MMFFLSLDFRLLPFDSAADDTATVLSLDAAADAHVLIPDESPNGVNPALVAGKRLVKLFGNVIHGMESRPGNSREVVVLVVQPHIVGQNVKGTVVGKGLWNGDLVVGVPLRRGDGLVDVVLGDEVARQRVQAAGEEGGEQQVEESVGRSKAEEEEVKGELGDDVEEVDPGHGDAVDGHGADGVEEDLERAEEGLAEDGVEHKGL